LKKTS